jgi:hypothetical protein
VKKSIRRVKSATLAQKWNGVQEVHTFAAHRIDLFSVALDRACRAAEWRANNEAQHGKVKIIMKDGKKVEE